MPDVGAAGAAITAVAATNEMMTDERRIVV